MKKVQNILILILLFVTIFPISGQEISKLSTKDLTSLPSEKANVASLGYAGMLGGVNNGVILAAGGANFPNGLPWEGGNKVWSNHLYIFENDQWRLSSTKLPISLGYSASVAIKNGILVIGGNNETITTDKVLLLSYNRSTKEVEVSEYPSLPEPLAFSSAVLVDDFVYVIGGKNATNSINSFYRFNLKEGDKWEELTDFPGAPRALHTTAVQETQTNKKLFVIGGRNQNKGEKSETLTNCVCPPETVKQINGNSGFFFSVTLSRVEVSSGFSIK